jgi:alpha/beta superfamily hydrolase
MRVDLQGPAGVLEGLLDLPGGDGRAAVVFGHPLPTRGGTMHTKVVYQSAKALARIGCAVLRFNFRGAGRSEGTFDGGPGEVEDYLAALSYLRGRFDNLECWAAGFSFGSWVAAAVATSDDRVDAYIGIGLPAASHDFANLETSTKPKFLIHGERDEVCPLGDVRRLYSRMLEPKELVVVDGADHLFDGKVGEVGDALEDLLTGFSARA